ncbi:MAG: carboxypeptidase regulatory-like domain-containing protein, partial [Candidatus Diapherotrites archaeon]
MGLSDSIKDFYSKAEEKYYSVLDWLDDKGLPVYKVVDAIEAQNIPSFPIAILFSLVVLLLIVWGISSLFFGAANIEIFVQDNTGAVVSAAAIKATLNGELVDETTTNAVGIADLQLPLNEEVEINVIAVGMNDKTVFYTAKESGEELTITMQKELVTLRKTINLMKAGTTRLIDEFLEVEFSCTGTSFTTIESTSNGIIELDVPSNCVTLTTRVFGNYTLSDDSISLSSETSFDLFLEEPEQGHGSVFVTVMNSRSETLAAIDVSLYLASETGGVGTILDSKQTSASGTAIFNSIPSGRFYIVAYDRSGVYGEYDGKALGIIQEVLENESTEFAVLLADNVVGSIKLLVKDKDTGDTVQNALVTLSKGETKITSNYTGADGKVEFSVGEDVEYDLMIDKAGYLIETLNMRPSTDFRQVELEQATLENSESLLVTVIDETGKPVENVRLKLKANSDGTQVGQELVTGLDGRGIFDRVENGLYYVYAVKPGFAENTSDPINLDNRSENVLEIRLSIGSGKIEATVSDDQGKPVTAATIKVVDFFSGQLLQEVSTDSDGKKNITVRADKVVFLIVSANDLASTTTTPIGLQKDVTIQKRITLTTDIQTFGIELDGLYVGGESVSESDRALNPGQTYTAKLRMLVPSNSSFEEAGVHIRTGKEDNQVMEKDLLYITNVMAAYDSIAKGTSYTAPTGETTDFQHQTTGNAKWANIAFSNVVGGIIEIEADIQIKSEAKIGSLLDIWYRAYGKSGGYIRVPSDAVLGTSASKGEKQGLYANASKRTYTAGPSSLCGEEFCSNYSITDLRENLTSSILDDYTAQISNKYRLIFDISSVSETPLSATQLSIKDRSSGISIDSYKIKTALGEEREGQGVGSEVSVAVGELRKDSVVGGEIIFETKKEGTIPLEISVISGTENAIEVYKKTIFVKILPAEELNIDVLPKIIVPLINNNLLVRVTDDNSTNTISNAFVSIKKNAEIIASGQTNAEGVFAYTLLSPAEGTVVGVLVEKTGYKPTEKQLKITSNILVANPETIKLSLSVGGTDFKTIDADLLNLSQIPLDVDSVSMSRDFEGFADIRFDEPTEGTRINVDGNSVLAGKISLGSLGKIIAEPLKLQGSINIYVSNSSFEQTWLASIPMELRIGFGDEVDDSGCFNVFPGEWGIFGSTTETKTMNFTVTNNCKVNGEKVSLRSPSVRLVSGNDNLFGTFRASSTIENGTAVPVDNLYKELAPLLNESAEETITLEFKPDNIISGASEVKVEIKAIHLTANGEEELTQKIDVSLNINNLSECVEILTNREIVINSCPFNTGYGNYGGGQFSQYNNSQYSAYDPYSSQYGYGTGLPPYIGSDYRQGPIAGDSYYDYQGANSINNYQNSYYPSAGYAAPYLNGNYGGSYNNPSYGSGYYGGGYGGNLGGISGGYGGVGGYSGGAYNASFNNSWNCNEGGFEVRNNCESPIDLSFDPQPGITVAEKTITIEPGEEETIKIEPTNFFGKYQLGIKAKPSESNEKSIDIATLNVNITNEQAKNYRDCISVSPSRTLNFNNFFGKPVELKVINSCFDQGVFLPFSNNAIMFGGTGVTTPTDAGSGFREMIESWGVLNEEFITGPNGRATQVMTFELVKALKRYKNNAPAAEFFSANDYANIGNLRYFLSSGMFTAEGRTNLRVNFTTPSGEQRTTNFPMVIKDYWSLLESVENIDREFNTFGDGRLNICECLNT